MSPKFTANFIRIFVELDFLKPFGEIDVTNKEEVRSFIAKIEEAAIQSENQVDFNQHVKHHFSKDVYARELFIPAGTLIIGKIHKHENFNILSKGEMSVLSVDGLQKVEAPFSVVSSPGVKRMAYAHTD